MSKKVLHFKNKVLDLQPGLRAIDISPTEWRTLYQSYRENGLKRLTKLFILTELCFIKNIDYDHLLLQISLKHHEPHAKNTGDLQRFSRRRFDPLHQLSQKGPNDFIFESQAPFSHFESPIAKTGARILRDLQTTSPEPGYSRVKKTPGGSKIHSVYSNPYGLTLYKHVTPEGSARTKGRVVPTERPNIVRQLIPKTSLSRPEAKTFHITIDHLIARKLSRRPISQTRLMRTSCHQFFSTHGCIVMKDEKNQYHWSHLIAYFLGGEQARENLTPGTAASNYNTLQLVELFIAKRLISQEVQAFTLRAEPVYIDDSLIPGELIFTITWIKNKKDYSEEIHINPRSHQLFTRSMRQTIALLREDSNEKTEDDSGFNPM